MPTYVIDSESLKDPRWLNQFPTQHVEVEFEPSSNSSKYHHVFFVPMDDSEQNTRLLQQELQKGWYSFRFSNTDIQIIYDDAVFRVPLYTEGFNFFDVLEHGRMQGIRDEQMNFKEYIHRYSTLKERL